MESGRLREVRISDLVAGRLFLCHMPGRSGDLEEYQREMREKGVTWVLCLASREEVRARSPAYAAALDAGLFRFPVDFFPIRDFGVPDDPEAFGKAVADVAGSLRQGERVLIHCAAGIGRTGLTAVCVLNALGLSPGEAEERVWAAGSGPATEEQDRFVREFAERLRRGLVGGA